MSARKFYDQFLFRIEIDGVTYAGFSECSDLKIVVNSITHREGGTPMPHKSPGLVDVPDITLSRGATDDRDLWSWMSEVIDTASGRGAPDPLYRRNFDLLQLDRNQTILERYRVFGAWPKEFNAGKRAADADEKVIESVVLSVDYFKPTIHQG